MKVTFIEHSGFMVEMEQNVLLFDYYQGEAEWKISGNIVEQKMRK